MYTRAVVVSLLVAACGKPTAEPPPMPGIAAEPKCGELGRLESPGASESFATVVSKSHVRFADDYAPVRAVVAHGRFHVVPGTMCPMLAYRLGAGVVADALVVADAGASDENVPSEVVLRTAYFEPDGNGFVVHAVPPRAAYAGMAVKRARAEVWISAHRRWVVADLDLEVEAQNGRIVLDNLELEIRGSSGRTPRTGLRLVALDVAGHSRIAHGVVRDAIAGDGMLVLDGLPTGTSRVHLRLEGWPELGSLFSWAHDTVISSWLPAVPHQDAFPRDLTVHNPADETVVVGAIASRPATGGGWVTTKLNDVGSDGLLLYAEAIESIDSTTFEPTPGTRITIAGEGTTGWCQPGITRAAEALAPLGPLGEIAIHGLTEEKRSWSYGFHSAKLVLIGQRMWQALCARSDPGAIALVTHELAHALFGGAVLASHDYASKWSEALAEYVSSWVLSPSEAVQLRRRWLTGYVENAAEDVQPSLQRARLPTKLRNAISYHRGALVLTALEDRVGRDTMAAVLKRFVADRRGHVATWEDVIAAVRAEAGDDDARFLEHWLRTPSAPELRLDGLVRRDGRVRGMLVQSAPLLDGSITIAVLGGDGELARETVTLTGEQTAIDLAAPDHATGVLIDPDHRRPLRAIPKPVEL